MEFPIGPPMIIKIEAGSIADPIWLACGPSGVLPNRIKIIVADDNPAPDLPSYVLHIASGKAAINRVADLYELHSGTDREGGGKTLAEYWDALGVHHKRSSLGRLTLEELLFPLVIDDLTANELPIGPHWYH